MTNPLDKLFSMDGKVVLITGASGGIGRVLAIAFAGAGATVGLHGTDPVRLDETRRLAEEAGGSAVVLPPADLGNIDACRALIADAHHALGRIDVLFNNAGMNRRKPVDDVTQDDFDTIVAVNLRSVLFLSQAVHSIMRQQGGGKIVNIGSMTSFLGLGTLAVYGITKSAVVQLTKTLAVEWARDNIQVNCLAPGFIMTPLTEEKLWGDPHKKQWLLDRIPAKRPGMPEDLLGAAFLLASGASNYMTGQTVAVDGGFVAGGSWERHDD
jgi:gluconate 5-dehydrogenase